MIRNLCLVFVSLLSVPAFAVYEVGDAVENLCWKDAEEKTLCLEDEALKPTVKVLLYNAGWCPPCNDELSEIAPRVTEFAGKPVTFLSLSASGWQHGSEPTMQFLKEWAAKHKITFPVLASPKDAGKKFIAPPIYIPNVAIVGKDGKLTYKAINPGVDVILDEVRSALSK